jgi:hypothetical protein
MTGKPILFAIALSMFQSGDADALNTREQLSFAICAIVTPTPKTIAYNGKVYELYGKVPGQSTVEPLFDLKTGTGFFVYSGKFFYLVTAKHIGTNCNDSGFVIVADVIGDQQKPRQATFTELTSTNSASFWLHDPSNDVSVLPIFGSTDFIKKFVNGRAYGGCYEMICKMLLQRY